MLFFAIRSTFFGVFSAEKLASMCFKYFFVVLWMSMVVVLQWLGFNIGVFTQNKIHMFQKFRMLLFPLWSLSMVLNTEFLIVLYEGVCPITTLLQWFHSKMNG